MSYERVVLVCFHVLLVQSRVVAVLCVCVCVIVVGVVVVVVVGGGVSSSLVGWPLMLYKKPSH